MDRQWREECVKTQLQKHCLQAVNAHALLMVSPTYRVSHFISHIRLQEDKLYLHDACNSPHYHNSIGLISMEKDAVDVRLTATQS